MKKLLQDFSIFTFSGALYTSMEIIFRGRSHFSMFLAGGICFLILFKLYKKNLQLSMPEKCIISAIVITSIEFIVGSVVNLWLNLNVWDYSCISGNALGQVCILYSVLWGFLGIPISYFSDKISSWQSAVKLSSTN
ncbi:MAG: hypothetical protein RUMPE_00404 [Eubacteriales bacterium SKADARSKE-1]|nr:hypothetical protein [Eubacteriales bacterium SKADARSKE-1]